MPKPTVHAVALDSAHAEHRSSSHGHGDSVVFPTGSITRSTLQPGWRWSEHVGREKGLSLCPAPHLGYVVAGRMVVVGEFPPMPSAAKRAAIDHKLSELVGNLSHGEHRQIAIATDDFLDADHGDVALGGREAKPGVALVGHEHHRAGFGDKKDLALPPARSWP